QPGTLAGAGEVADLPVGDQVGGGPITLVEEGEGAVAGYLLITGAEGMAAQAVGEQRTPGAVIHFTGIAVAGFPETAAAVAFGATGGTGVLAVGGAAEIAQVAFQCAYRQGPVVGQAEEVLFVEVIQIAVVILRGEVLGQLVVAAGKVEGVAVRLLAVDQRRAGDAQADVVAGTPRLGAFQLAGDQGQAVNFVGGDLPSLEGLRQQATVVE